MKEHIRLPRQLRFIGCGVVFFSAAPAWAMNNAGLEATVSASSVSSFRPDLYDSRWANDGKANPDNWYHWSNDGMADPASATNPVSLTFSWASPRSIRKIVLHTKRDFEVQDFRIEYRDGAAWTLFDGGDVTGNLETRVELFAAHAVETDAIRLTATRGPEQQPGLVRISELEAIEDDPAFDLPAALVAIREFQPDKPLVRAGRPVVLTARLFNRHTQGLAATPHLAPPAGMLVRQSANGTPFHLADQTEKPVQWVVEFAAPGDYDIPLTVAATAGGTTARTLTLRVLPEMAVPPAAEVPDPQPVTTGPLIGALNWPYWSGGVPDFWKAVLENPERTPALGLYGQETAQVNDWELKWAAEHGIGFFVYNWTREGRGLPSSQWTFPFGNNHIAQRLTNSRFTSAVRCAIQFNNGPGSSGIDGADDLIGHLAPYWIETFFRRPDYQKVDNRPLLFVYDAPRFVEDLGGVAGAAAALAAVRAQCVEAGFDGLYVVGESRFYDIPEPDGPEYRQVEQLTQAGFDATYAYHWYLGDSPEAGEAVDRQMTYYERARGFDLAPPIMTASMGWTGWRSEASTWRIPPEGYESLLRRIKAVNETLPPDSLGSRMVLLDNWNEFGEGHYLAPHREYGFGYLDAVRKVFAPDNPVGPPDLIPEDLGLGPYDTAFKSWIRRDAAWQPFAAQKVARAAEPGLIAWWAFDEQASFPVAYDYSGNRLGGIMRGAVRMDGPSGQALRPQGGCVTVAADERLSPAAGFTVSCWVRADQDGQDGTYILNRLHLGNDSGYQLGLLGGKPFFRVPQSAQSHLVAAANDLPAGRWVHLAATCDGKAMRLFVDGQEAGVSSRFGKVNANNATLTIGNYAEGPAYAANAFVGLIDELKIHNRALTPEEIAARAAAGLAAVPGADAQDVVMSANTAKRIVLAGTHPGTARVASPPTHGTLSGTGAERTYTPRAGFHGTDSFSFTVQDGTTVSAPATVSVTVIAGPGDGLVGWWKMDELGGSVVADSSGRGNHGSMSGGTWIPGKTGSALKLNGTDGHATIPDSEDLDGLAAMTMAAWIRLERMPPQIVAPLAKETGDQSYRIIVGSSGAAQFVAATADNGWYAAGGWVDAPPNTFAAGKWQHVVGTYDGARLRFYVDGRLVGTGSHALSGAVRNGISPLTFGLAGDYGGNYFDGAMDDVRLYHRALSPTEVRQLVAATGGPSLFEFWAGEGTALTPGLLRRYAIGGAVGPADKGTEPLLRSVDGTVMLGAIVRTDDPELTVLAEYTPDLRSPWSPLAANPAGVKSPDQTNVAAGCERRDFVIPPGPEGRGFVRLRAVYLRP